KFNRISFFETPKVLLLAWDRVFEIKDALGNKQYKLEDIKELFRKLLDDLQNIHEELAEYINTPGWNRPACYDDDDDEESSNSLEDNIISELPPCVAITPTEPVDSLSMGDEHLDTIPATESNEFIKSSVKNLVPNPSESEGENEPPGKDLFEHSLFDEFAGELTLLKSIPPGFDETICHPKEETHFTKRLLYDNSSSRPPKEVVSENSNADIESFSPSSIPIKDSDSHMEEIDLSFNPDGLMPPGIEEDDDDSERDILILEELLDNYSLSLPEIESFHFDIPSSYCPPAKPPDGNTRILNIKMIGDISDQKVPIPNLMITRVSSQEKSSDLLPHQGLEAFQSSAECLMMINGKNTPILDVLFFHFYPFDQNFPVLPEERSNSLKDNIISGLPPCAAITPISLTEEPVDSLIMGDEHLNTISATELDEFIKSSVENLVPNPSESEGENECDVPTCFTTFSNILFDADYDFYSVDDQSLSDEDIPKKIYSNPLFDEEIISMKIDPHHFNAESDLIKSLLNHDSSLISSSSKIDFLFDEFAGELTLLKSIPPGISETDCDHENEIRLTKRLLYDNSSPHLPKEFVSEKSNAAIESFYPSHIAVEDSDSLIEEIDLFFTLDDPMPPGIKEDDYDSERDILILEELLDSYSLSPPENESFHFDIPSSSRPPAKPPDGNT
nr:hypothetical protein [Tanacetum cinerariifolium]